MTVSVRVHPGDIVVCVDTHWRERYADRTQHPEHDAEKVRVVGDQVTVVLEAVKNGAPIGRIVSVALPNGSTLSAGTLPTTPPGQ